MTLASRATSAWSFALSSAVSSAILATCSCGALAPSTAASTTVSSSLSALRSGASSIPLASLVAPTLPCLSLASLSRLSGLSALAVACSSALVSHFPLKGDCLHQLCTPKEKCWATKKTYSNVAETAALRRDVHNFI
ncbi:hypothetical protein RvY_18231-2 [Ramazzottius varieornatus]|uniref:Secreted protein n=1 Tax=Ramazzottius varieornatus TaxID=947166 RepID=A0A1D1W544_RAMVA|nr:hypothetical protein RvY_18231-2 [Ramazzottius varieornatus]